MSNLELMLLREKYQKDLNSLNTTMGKLKIDVHSAEKNKQGYISRLLGLDVIKVAAKIEVYTKIIEDLKA